MSVACTGYFDDSGIFSLVGLDTTELIGIGQAGADTLLSIVQNAKSNADGQWNWLEGVTGTFLGGICGAFGAVVTSESGGWGGYIGVGLCGGMGAGAIYQGQASFDSALEGIINQLTNLKDVLPISGAYVVLDEHYIDGYGIDWERMYLSLKCVGNCP